MPVEQIGRARLYRSPNCRVTDGNRISLVVPLGSTRVVVGIGESLLTYAQFTLGRGVPRRKPRKPQRQSTRVEQQPPASKFGDQCYTELIALQQVSVDEATSIAFRQKDPAATNVLRKLTKERKDQFTAALDVAAASVGLYLNPRLVSDQVSEVEIALRGGSTSYSLSVPFQLRIGNEAPFSTRDVDLLQKRIRVPTDLKKAAQIAPWLLRAWSAEDDPVAEFMALFVPLEMALEQEPADRNWKRAFKSLRRFIREHGNPQEEKMFLEFLSKNVQRPSLMTRFEAHARRARLADWRTDLVIAPKFNGMRNDLLHRGRQVVATEVEVGEREVRSLMDLVHRYVGRKFYGRAVRRPRSRRRTTGKK